MDDSAIIYEIRNGSHDALNELMDKYGDRLLRSAYLITKDYGLAQDALQETFINAYYKMALYKEQCSLYTWLYSIMLNNCRKKLRSLWIKKVILRGSQEEFQTSTYGDFNEDVMDIRFAINKLPENYRRLVVMFYFEDFTIKQICEATGKKEGTVKSSLNRLRKILKNYLKGGYEYGEQSGNGHFTQTAD